MNEERLQEAGFPQGSGYQPDFDAAQIREKNASPSRLSDKVSNRIVDFGLALLAGVLGLGVALLMPQQVSGHTMGAITDFRSPAFFPALGAVFMCCLALILAVRVWRNAKIALPYPAGTSDSVLLGRVSSLAVLIVTYTAGVFLFGMILASTVFIAGASLIFGYRNPWMIASMSLGTPALVFVLFEKTLNVLFPRGLFF